MKKAKSLFTKEMKAFAARKAELLDVAEGKFAVFKGPEFLGVFDTSSAAYDAGIAKYGNVPFLIKEVREHDRVEQVPIIFWGIPNACT